MKNHQIWILACTLTGGLAFGQTVNYGGLYIKSNTEMSTLFSLENKNDAILFNNGTLYIYNNLINDGLFDYNTEGKNKSEGQTIFTSNNEQIIGGNSVIKMNNVVFNNSTPESAFNVSTDIVTKGIVEFEDGIVTTDKDTGSFTFLQNSSHLKVSDRSYVDGAVDKEGTDAFVFPIGNKGFYRESAISKPKTSKDIFSSKYIYNDKQFFADKKNKAGVIKLINENEYWLVQKGKDVSNDVFLTLKWDERTTDLNVLTDPEKDLHIVRWDEKQLMWVDEGGVVDIGNGSVTTLATLKGYGFFTLATVKTELLLEGDVVIYNIVTADGDGVNDYFLIDNIQKFPNNSVQIYNRWGAKVFETKNYDSNGNVFDGYSKGKMTLNDKEKLPSGTYYYVIVYEVEKEGVSRTIKKAGYLHLETK